jgi:hypothetical protein
MNWKEKVLSLAGAAVLGLGISGGALADDTKGVTVAVTQSGAPDAEFFYAFVGDADQPLSGAAITGLAGDDATGTIGLQVKDTRVAVNRVDFNLQISSTDFTALGSDGTTVVGTIAKSAFSLTDVTGTSPSGVTTITTTPGAFTTPLNVVTGDVPHEAFDTVTYDLDLSLAVPADTLPEDYRAVLTVTDTINP